MHSVALQRGISTDTEAVSHRLDALVVPVYTATLMIAAAYHGSAAGCHPLA